jgi:hypothetical protein
VDSDPQTVWVPKDSITASQQRYFDAAFDPFFRINQVIVSLDTSSNSNVGDEDITGTIGILQQPYLAAVLELQNAISTATASDGTQLSDVCFRPIPGQGCLVETPLDYFRSNMSTVAQLTPALIQDAISCRSILGQSYIPCMNSIGVPVQQAVVLGGVRCPDGDIPGYNKSVCGECGTYADALILTFLLDNTDALAPHGETWEHDVFLPLASSFKFPGLQVSYMAERSIQDQLAIVDDQNQDVVVISYVVMFFYIALALGKFPHPIATRALLGFQGIVLVVVSVAASIGLLAAGGQHITMIVTEVVPFLILAIGVDNMFILTKAFDGRWWGPMTGARVKHLRAAGLPCEANPLSPRATSDSDETDDEEEEDRKLKAAQQGGADIDTAVVDALAEVGPTITAAAASEVLAFALGATTRIPALQQFCAVAALAVGVDYFLQMTWFLAAIVLDARRQEARRMDGLFCLRLRGPGVKESHWSWPRAQKEDSADDAEYDGGLVESLLSAEDSAGPSPGGSGRYNARRPKALSDHFVEEDAESATIDIGLDAGYGNGYAAHLAENAPGVYSSMAPHASASGSAPSVLDDAHSGHSGKEDLFVQERRRSTFVADTASSTPVQTPTASLNAGGRSGSRGLTVQTPARGESRPLALNEIAQASAIADVSGMSSRKLRIWHRINRGHYVRTFLEHIYAPVIFWWPVRLAVLALWLAAIGGSVYATTQLQLGLEQQLVLPEGSYLKPYFDQQCECCTFGP